MASLIYTSSLEDLANGAIDFGSDTFKVMLVTSSYTPNKNTHTKRSDVTNEVVGTGYTSGGIVVAATVTKDTGNSRVDVDFADPTWSNATITAFAAVIYKSRGGAASADELVAYVEFDEGTTSSTRADFDVTFTSPFRFQN